METVVLNGEKYKVLLKQNNGLWVINLEGTPKAPFFVMQIGVEKISSDGDINPEQPAKKRSIKSIQKQNTQIEERIMLIYPLIANSDAICSSAARNKIANEIASHSSKSKQTILRMYYRYLAFGKDGLTPRTRQRGLATKTVDAKNFRWAVKKYHYSSRKLSLKKTYEMMLLDKYSDRDGILHEEYPSYSKFRHFFYNHIRSVTNAVISQNGLSYYQRNARPLYGKAIDKADGIGIYEMDATEADVYLVSKHDRKQSIGRPIIYIAVDRATQLITGVYVGLKGGAEAVIECIRNAARDKIEYCKRYDIDITEEQWPCSGLPGTIVTDRGREFLGKRVEEVCNSCGIMLDTLPPYRPELKGTVEKMLDLLQQQIKPMIIRKGAIESDFAERGAPDYRLEATLSLREYTQLVIHSVIYCNSLRIQSNYSRSEDMILADVIPTASALWIWFRENDISYVRPLVLEEVVLLPRAKASLTRKGLEFNSLTYRNDLFTSRCVKAGSNGAEEVTVAYSEAEPEKIWLYESGSYFEFVCISGKSEITGLSFYEIREYIKHERQLYRGYEKMMLPKILEQNAAMRKIAQTASEEKGAASDASTLSKIDEARRKEAGNE